jgi:WD40 repeat protein
LPVRAPLEQLAASQDGRWLAAPDYAKATIAVWDAETGHSVTNIPAPGIDQVWFSPNSQWLVASVENAYSTWETGAWRSGRSWPAHLDSGDPGELAFSDDSRLVVARQERETFRLMTFPECRELVTLKPPLVVPMRSACFSPDGSRVWLLAAGYRLFEWNLGQLRTELAKLGLDWEQQ